jgi:hypothetical protein
VVLRKRSNFKKIIIDPIYTVYCKRYAARGVTSKWPTTHSSSFSRAEE